MSPQPAMAAIGLIKRWLAQTADPWADIGRHRQELGKAEERVRRLAD